MASASTASPAKPEIFRARGLVIDTRLEVFGTVFHVHSTILKLYSHFFATYMDSADKVESALGVPSGTIKAYKYEWVCKVLEGGNDWQLVCAGNKTGDLSVAPSGIDQDKETTGFRNLLNAMYNIPYKLVADEIVALTRISRFYMALPVVSRSLDRVFRESVEFIGSEIRNNACQMLCAAAELRHPTLFTDAMIWCLGPFNSPVYETLDDPKLRRLADHMYCKLNVQVLYIRRHMIGYQPRTKSAKEQVNSISMKEVELGMEVEASSSGGLLVPKLNRDLNEWANRFGEEGSDIYALLIDDLNELLASNLALGNMAVEAGDDLDGCEDHFLLDMLREEDYPWDSTELDW